MLVLSFTVASAGLAGPAGATEDPTASGGEDSAPSDESGTEGDASTPEPPPEPAPPTTTAPPESAPPESAPPESAPTTTTTTTTATATATDGEPTTPDDDNHEPLGATVASEEGGGLFATAEGGGSVGTAAGYVASLSPLEYDGEQFAEPPPDMTGLATPGTLWVTPIDGDPTTWVSADDAVIASVSGSSDIDAVLLEITIDATTSRVTGFFDATFGLNSCADVIAFIEGDESFTCVGFKDAYFANNGAGTDYTQGDVTGFVDASGAPLPSNPGVVPGTTAPATLVYDEAADGGGGGGGVDGGYDGTCVNFAVDYLDGTGAGNPYAVDLGAFGEAGAVTVVSGDTDPPTLADGGSGYVASFSPLSWSGTDFDGQYNFLGAAGGDPFTSVSADGTTVNGVDGTADLHGVLVDYGGTGVTWVVDEGFFAVAEGGPYTEDCTGFDAMAAVLFDGDGGGDVGVAQAGGYYASNSPLSYGGTAYDDPQFGGTAPGVFYLAGDDEHDPPYVEADDTLVGAIGADGTPRDIDVGLISAGGSHVTVYVDSGVIAALGGSRDCTALETAMIAIGAGSWTCDSYMQTVLDAPGSVGDDYAFTDLDGFSAGGPVAVVGGFTSPPYLRYSGGGGGGGAEYVASRTPLDWNGDTYGNVHLLAMGDVGGGTGVGADDTPVPNVDGTRDYHVALLTLGAQRFTYVIDAGFFGGGFDCPAVETFLSLDGVTNTCDNAKAGYFGANGADAAYSWNGVIGFDEAGAVTVTAGGTDPAYLRPSDGGGGGETPPDHGGEGVASEYETSNTPLVLDGVVYGDLWPGHPEPSPKATYLTAGDPYYSDFPAASTVTFGDGVHVRGIPGAEGLQSFHTVLLTVTGDVQQDGGGTIEVTRSLTLYMDNGILQPAEGTQYSRDCAGIESFFADNGNLSNDIEPAPVVNCVAFHVDTLVAPDEFGDDYTFAGFSSWTDGNGDPMVGVGSTSEGDAAPAGAGIPTVESVCGDGDDACSDPYLVHQSHTRFYGASVAPFSFGGNDFTARFWAPSTTGNPGANWATGIQNGDEFVYADGQRPRGIPSFAGLNDFAAVLFELDGRYVTLYLEDIVGTALGISPLSCAQFDDYLENVVDILSEGTGDITYGCHAISTEPVLIANGFCEDYTYDPEASWVDGAGDPITTPALLDDTPALRWVGPSELCTGDSPGEEPPGGGPSETPGGDMPGGGTGDGGSDGSSTQDSALHRGVGVGTLPRTGIEAFWLAVAGLGLVLLGAGLAGAARRRRPALGRVEAEPTRR